MKFARLTLAVLLVLGTAGLASADSADDARTTLKVKLALLDKLGADSLHVDVDSAGGRVVLRGTVAKRETMELAETVAESVTGVADVDNDLQVTSPQPSKAGSAVGEAEAEVRDAVLASKVRLALVDKMGTDGFRIGTDVANGVVTLEFDRDMATERRKDAMATVKTVDGVAKVLSVEER